TPFISVRYRHRVLVDPGPRAARGVCYAGHRPPADCRLSDTIGRGAVTMTAQIWWDGRLLAEHSATIPVTADAVLRGINVFEGLLAYRQQQTRQYAVISYGRHLERLIRSADLMYLPTPAIADRVTTAIGELFTCRDAQQIYLRPTLCLTQGYYADVHT